MTSGWSAADKATAHKAAIRAQAGAESEALALFQAFPVKKADDLWNLELKIREWRRDRKNVFTLHFGRAEDQLSDWLARGWINSQDIQPLSEPRRERIHAKTGFKKQ